MKSVVIFIICALTFAVAVIVEARMGETPEECERRYGAAITNYPGYGNVDSVKTYLKDDIAITAFFIKKTNAMARVSMIIYSRLRPSTKGVVIPSPKMTEKEEATLLATVAGRWEKFEPSEELKGKPAKMKSLTTQPSITIKQRNETAEVLKKVVEVLYLPSRQTCFLQPPESIAHNGPKIFAFRVACGVAICSYDEADTIRAWVEQIIVNRDAAPKKPEKDLSGF